MKDQSNNKQHIQRQNSNSADSPMLEKNENFTNKQTNYGDGNRKSQSAKEKPLYFKSLEAIVTLMVAIIFIFIMFALFSLFLNFFSLLYTRIITTVISLLPVGFVKAIKALSKRREINSELKDLAELLTEMAAFIEKCCKTSFLSKGVCIIIVVPFVIALLIPCIPKIGAKTTAEVNDFWENMQNWVESLPSDEADSQHEENVFYHPEMTFIISKKDYSDEITPELLSEAYFCSVDNLLAHLKSIYHTKEPFKKMSEYYGAQEALDRFSDAVEVGKAYKILYGQDENWYSKLPNEEDLQSVIKEQELKAESYPSYHIYNCLSNNYQTLALEYHHQNANKSSIKYFYLMSIKYDIKSIEYATEKEELYTALDRIITRYDDILLCCDYDDNEKLHLESLIEDFV